MSPVFTRGAIVEAKNASSSPVVILFLDNLVKLLPSTGARRTEERVPRKMSMEINVPPW